MCGHVRAKRSNFFCGPEGGLQKNACKSNGGAEKCDFRSAVNARKNAGQPGLRVVAAHAGTCTRNERLYEKTHVHFIVFRATTGDLSIWILSLGCMPRLQMSSISRKYCST